MTRSLGKPACALHGCFCLPYSLSEKTLLLFTVTGGSPTGFPPSPLLGIAQRAVNPAESCQVLPLQLHPALGPRPTAAGLEWTPVPDTPLLGLLQLLSVSSCGRAEQSPGAASLPHALGCSLAQTQLALAGDALLSPRVAFPHSSESPKIREFFLHKNISTKEPTTIFMKLCFHKLLVVQ